MATDIREGDVFVWPDGRRLQIDWINEEVGYRSWGRLIRLDPSWRRTPRDVFDAGLDALAPWCCVSRAFEEVRDAD